MTRYILERMLWSPSHSADGLEQFYTAAVISGDFYLKNPQQLYELLGHVPHIIFFGRNAEAAEDVFDWNVAAADNNTLTSIVSAGSAEEILELASVLDPLSKTVARILYLTDESADIDANYIEISSVFDDIT